jgi:hypothetical protein
MRDLLKSAINDGRLLGVPSGAVKSAPDMLQSGTSM